MSVREKRALSKIYVLGRKNFAAISAVEGLELGSEGVVRFKRSAGLPLAQRRAETIRAFAGARKRG